MINDIQSERIRDTSLPKPRPRTRGLRPELFSRASWRNLELKNETLISGFHSGPARKVSPCKLILFSVGATCVDVLVGVGICLLLFCAACLGLHAGPHGILRSLQAWGPKLGIFGFCLPWIWGVAILKASLRSAMGCTLGEWAWGLRLGSLKARESQDYTRRVWLRCLISQLTGVIFLPLASLLTNRDWAGRISGLYLQAVKDSNE